MIKPTLLLDFTNSRQLPPAIDFLRASTATYFSADGLLHTAAINGPRIDWDPHSRECLGLLIESSRTNLALWCRDLTQAAWTKQNCTASRDATGIDGIANSASTVTATASDATVLQGITSASNARVTSVYCRRVTGTGDVDMTQDGGATWTPITLTDGWYRYALAQVTSANPVIGFRLHSNGDAIAVDYMQHETGTTPSVPTSPILTTSTTATRAADNALIQGAAFTRFHNPEEGTLYVVGESAATAGYTRFAALSDNSSQSNAIQVLHSGPTSMLSISVYDEDVQQAIFSAAYTHNEAARVAVAYRANDIAISYDGTTPYTDTSCTLPTVDRLTLGISGAMTNPLDGHLLRVVYWPVRLGNSELQQLTT